MIITVTLNAAVDKTLAVPNFRVGRRHREVVLLGKDFGRRKQSRLSP